MNALNQLSEPIAILNGGFFLDGTEDILFRFLLPQAGFKPMLLDGLFSNAEKLIDLKINNVKTIIIQTTGQSGSDISKCLESFKKIDFIPENIVLIFPDALWSTAKNFKDENPNTKIWECFASEIRKELITFEEIEF